LRGLPRIFVRQAFSRCLSLAWLFNKALSGWGWLLGGCAGRLSAKPDFPLFWLPALAWEDERADFGFRCGSSPFPAEAPAIA